MRTHRFAIAGVALVASTILISCGSDDDEDAPVDSGAPIVADSTIATLPIADTVVVGDSTGSSVDDSTDTTLP